MRALYSEDIYALLERVGEHRTKIEGSRPTWLLLFQNRKWLLRPSSVGRCVWAAIRDGGARHWLRTVRWLLGIRVIRLYSEGRLSWRWARVRDKEHKKISFFDPDGKHKHVYWAERRDFDRELALERHFAAHGVKTVPFEASDQSRLLAAQPLVGAMFRHPDTLSPIDAQLLEYVVRTSRLQNVGDYVTRVAGIAGSSGPEAEAYALASRHLARLAPQDAARFPMTLVHGDLSRQNIVWNEAGEAFLIDFDRAFEASGYYDFVFAGLFTPGFGLVRSRQCVVAINARLMPEVPMAPEPALTYALVLFVLDNILYLNQSFIDASSKALTRKVMSRACRTLASMAEDAAT